MPNIRVAIISPYSWIEPDFGGQVRIFQIAKNLGESGLAVHLFTGWSSARLELKNVYVHVWTELRGLFTYYPITLENIRRVFMRTLKTVKSLEQFSKSDVIISELLNTAWHSIVIQKLLMKPAILDEHNIEWSLAHQYGVDSRYHWQNLKTFEEICWRSFSCVAVTSERDREIVQRSNPKKSVTLVPNGVDLERFKPEPGLGQT